MVLSLKGMPAPTQLSPAGFLSSLHKCKAERNLALTLKLHNACMCERQFLIVHPSLADQLIAVLVAFGRMTHAQQVFDTLSTCKQGSWDALVIGYVKQGDLHHAISLYRKLRKEHTLSPSGNAYVVLLKACGALHELEAGSVLHEDIAKAGLLDQNIFVGSALVEMYMKFGLLNKALNVFDSLRVVDVVLWTLLIAGYVDHGFGEKAYVCYERMQETGVSPDILTFVCGLRACGSMGVKIKGMKVHIDIVKKGLHEHLLVGNALVDMYAKCGLLETARKMFENLPKDVDLWNALIGGYTKHNQEKQALHLFDQMQCECIPSNSVTFVHSLKACCITENGLKGREIYLQIVLKGYEKEVFLSSTLVNMYAKGGLLADAQAVFDMVASPNEVLCNALLSGYLEHRSSEEALSVFESMQCEGRPVGAITFVLGLKCCRSAGAMFKGQEVHAEIVGKGLEGDLLVGGTIVDMYGKYGALNEAHSVFDKLPYRDVVSWTALMVAYSDHGHNEEVLVCHEKMQHGCISLNAITCICVLKACGNTGSTERGLRLHADIMRKGLDSEVLVGNTLVEMYAKCRRLVTAQSVFDRLHFHDPIAYNALIVGYLEKGAGDKALMCLGQIQLGNHYVSALTLTCGLRTCACTGSISKGQCLHLEIVKKGLDEELLIANTLIDTYAKCGLLKEAHSLFQKLPSRSVVSWSALISGYAQLGKAKTVFNLVDDMIKDGIVPNLVTCVSVLNACGHAGLVSEGCWFFKFICCELGFIPSVEHYTCIVDMLGRVGHIDKAFWILWRMPMQPCSTSWQNVLGACHKWGDVEHGRHAFDHAVRIDDRDTRAYVYMYNIYADASRPKGSSIFTTV